MRHKVEITARAASELKEAYLWIRKDSPARAASWRKRLLAAVKTLAVFPERCGLAPESSSVEGEIRQLVFGWYRILYEIRGREVRVLHIRHAARNYLPPEELGFEQGED
jgi:plasmid stabilization system protein ParE